LPFAVRASDGDRKLTMQLGASAGRCSA
jgi:hypothetical protein